MEFAGRASIKASSSGLLERLDISDHGPTCGALTGYRRHSATRSQCIRENSAAQYAVAATEARLACACGNARLEA